MHKCGDDIAKKSIQTHLAYIGVVIALTTSTSHADILGEINAAVQRGVRDAVQIDKSAPGEPVHNPQPDANEVVGQYRPSTANTPDATTTYRIGGLTPKSRLQHQASPNRIKDKDSLRGYPR